MSVPITKPTVGGDNNVWGGVNNTALDALNAADRFVVRTTDQAVVSSTALVDDTALQLTLPIGTHIVQATYFLTGNAAGDAKVAWAFAGTAANSYRGGQGPSFMTADATGAAMLGQPFRAAGSSGTGVAITGAAIYGMDGSAVSHVQEVAVMVVTVAGLLKVQFAQNASNATATTMKAGSYLYARQVA